MEGLLPVIIALVISAVFGMRKKKGPAEQAPAAPEESPWDDLMRELQKRSDTPPQDYVPEEEAEAEDPQPYFTYEEIPQAQPLSYDTPEPVELAEPVREEAPLAPQLVASGMDLTLPSEGAFRALTDQEVYAAVNDSRETEEDGGGTLFESGFDPRMAVLYSEVLRPKYQD